MSTGLAHADYKGVFPVYCLVLNACLLSRVFGETSVGLVCDSVDMGAEFEAVVHCPPRYLVFFFRAISWE